MLRRVFQMSLLVMGLCVSVAQAQDALTIQDMRGKTVAVPKNLTRIATISDGFVEGVLTHLGEAKKIAAISSYPMITQYPRNFVTKDGEKYTYANGSNTMRKLHPWLLDVPLFGSRSGSTLNFETLAKSKPQLVIMRVGDCSARASNPEALAKTIQTIESLGFPLVVLYAPKNNLKTIRKEMEVIGSLFGKQKQAVALADYLYKTVEMVKKRTKGIPENKKAKLLLLGLNQASRDKGGVGSVYGINTPEVYIVEQIANAKSAYRGKARGLASTEQMYSMAPDVIALPTSRGFHPPRELLEGADFTMLSELPAIKNKRVVSMPYTPRNCARRVEYPLDVLIIAKAAYPERFKDIKVHEFALKFYQDVYGVDLKGAQGLVDAQYLGWMKENNF